MQQIPNVQTTAEYANATTLGPDAFEAITVNVWNFSALMQVFTAPPGGYQVGEWTDEVLCPPGQYNLDRCGGVRFKTNPATPSSPARIIAAGWRDGEPRIVGGVEYTTTLSSSGGVSASAMLTGSVNGNGTIAQGSGFTATRTAAGTYQVDFNTQFPSAPTVIVASASTGNPCLPVLTDWTIQRFNVVTRRVSTEVITDSAFTFLVEATV